MSDGLVSRKLFLAYLKWVRASVTEVILSKDRGMVQMLDPVFEAIWSKQGGRVWAGVCDVSMALGSGLSLLLKHIITGNECMLSAKPVLLILDCYRSMKSADEQMGGQGSMWSWCCTQWCLGLVWLCRNYCVPELHLLSCPQHLSSNTISWAHCRSLLQC